MLSFKRLEIEKERKFLFSWFQKGIYLNFNLCMNFKNITYLETLLWEISPCPQCFCFK